MSTIILFFQNKTFTHLWAQKVSHENTFEKIFSNHLQVNYPSENNDMDCAQRIHSVKSKESTTWLSKESKLSSCKLDTQNKTQKDTYRCKNRYSIR